MTRRARLWFAAAVLVALIGSEAALAWHQQRKLALQEHTVEILERRATRLIAERARAQRELRASPAQAAEPDTTPASATAVTTSAENAAAAWIARVHRLRSAFDADPARKIPELECLTPAEWLDLTQAAAENDGAEDTLRVTLAHVRGEAKFAFLHRMQEALVLYCHAHAGELPARVAELGEFFETPPPAGALERYAMARNGKFSATGPREAIVVEHTLSDELYDSRYALVGAPSVLPAPPIVHISPSAQNVNQAIERAQRLFAQQHNGEKAATPDQLTPFLDRDSVVKASDVQMFWDSSLREK